MGKVQESGGVECVINEMKWPGAFRPGAGGHSLDVVRAVDGTFMALRLVDSNYQAPLL